MIGIASGMLRGQQDTFTEDRVARGNVDAVREAGLPQYGNVYNFDFYREVKHVRSLILDGFENV